MRKLSRITVTILIFVLMLLHTTAPVNAGVWTLGTDGPGKNPFTPRGYLIETDKGVHWLSSGYDNSSSVIRYSGVRNGVDYVDATKEDGSNYTFYAMTDRNPWSQKTNWVGYNKKFFVAYKNGRRISNFNDYVQTPATRGDSVDPSGQGTCWVFRIEGFELEPGCSYEFGFQRGMQANNGITLVLAEDEEGRTIGYVRQSDADSTLTSTERQKYDSEKYLEYEFVSSWYLNEDGIGYTVNQVPMRFSLQTYADLTTWEDGSQEARDFLASVTEQDYREGKYKRENVENLRTLIESYDEKAENEVKYMLQALADTQQRNMVGDVNEMLEKARTEKPEPADMSRLEALIEEGEDLYSKASVNVGNDIGQYGRIEVNNLRSELDSAKKLDEFYPQSEINDQADRLEDAIEEVRASKVMEEQRIFYDKVTGIYVIAPADSLPEEASLVVTRMGPETPEYKNAAANLSETETESVYYKIQFFEGDRKIQPEEKVNVQMPIPMEMSQDSSNVYSVDGNGNLTRLASARSNGMIYYDTDHLEAFVLAGSTATEEEKANRREEESGSDQQENQGDSSQDQQDQMEQRDDEEADNKQTEIEEEQVKKEEAEDPIDKILDRSINNATFGNDVMKETTPMPVIYIAVLMAIAALVLGFRGLMDMRNKKDKDTE